MQKELNKCLMDRLLKVSYNPQICARGLNVDIVAAFNHLLDESRGSCLGNVDSRGQETILKLCTNSFELLKADNSINQAVIGAATSDI